MSNISHEYKFIKYQGMVYFIIRSMILLLFVVWMFLYLWIEWIYLDIFLIFSKYLSIIVNALSFDHTYTKNYQVPISIFFFWILTKLKCLKGSKTRWISCKVIDNKSAFEHAFIQRKLSSLVTWLFCLQDKCPFHLKSMYFQKIFTMKLYIFVQLELLIFVLHYNLLGSW